MKTNFKSSLVIFLVAMLVMQVIFNDGREAGAAHSATGKIAHVNSIRVIVEDGSNKLSPCYCISRTLYCQNNDIVTSDVMDIKDKAFLLNAAFLYGYHANVSNQSQITAAAIQNYNMTQDVIWLIMEGKFDGTTKTTAANINYDQTIINKVVLLNTEPSYVNVTNTVDWQWDETKAKFVGTLTNTAKYGNESANTNVHINTAKLPKGLTATVEGDVIKLESSEVLTGETSFEIYKSVPEKGKVVAWKNGNGSKQPQITLDYDEDPVAKVMTVKIGNGTGEKPVKETPTPAPTEPAVTPEPTVEPTVKAEEPKEEVKAEPEIEIKEAVEETEKDLDEVPKTADASNVGFAVQLLAASGITLVWFAVVTLVKRRKESLAE